MTARERDLFQFVGDGLPFLGLFRRDGGQPHNGVHRRPDIVRHRGEEDRFGVVRRLRLLRHLLQSLIDETQIDRIDREKEQQSDHDHPDQEPVLGLGGQRRTPDIAEHDPPVGRRNRRVRDQAGPASRVLHKKAAARRSRFLFQFLKRGVADGVVGFIKLVEIAALERVALDDVIAVGVDHRQLRRAELLLREHPLFLQIRDRNDPQQVRVPRFAGIVLVGDPDPVDERQRLLPVHRIGERPRNVYGLPDVGDPFPVADDIDVCVGNAILALLLPVRRAGG